MRCTATALFVFLVGCYDEATCPTTVGLGAPLHYDAEPDFKETVDIVASSPLGGLSSGRAHVEVWDCLDPSWWSDVQPRKVVQILSWSDHCPGIDYTAVEEYDCDSPDSPDLAYR